MKIKRQKIAGYKILFFSMVLEFMFVSPLSAYNLNEYYPLSQGNTWTYSVIEDGNGYKETVKIEGIEIIEGAETVRIKYAGDEYTCLAIDSEGIEMYKYFDNDEYEMFNPPAIVFPNIEKGDTKRYSFNSIIYNVKGKKIGEAVIDFLVTLEAVEDVEVAAGKFNNCLKFSTITEWKEKDGKYERDDCTDWLSRGVGMVKEFCLSTEHDAETKEEEMSTRLSELSSAIVDGKKIGDKE